MFWSLPKSFGATKWLGIYIQCLLRCSGLWLTLLCGKDPIFSKIRDVTGTMFLSLTYRLRGASYRICGAPYRPKSKRWKRHYLCMLSPSGVFPLPLKLWLAFPDLGVLTPGVARAFILGLSSAFALFVMKRKEKFFEHFIQFRGRTLLIASFFNHGLRCG